MTDQPRDDPARYDQLGPIGRALVDDYDVIDLAAMLVKAQDELAQACAEINRYANTDSADAAAGSYAMRAETAERERDEARQHAAAIAAQRDRLRQRMNALADRWDAALAVDKSYARTLRNEISCAPFDPEGAMTVREYTERGHRLWAFRCWGTDTCDGWLGLGHYTQTSALRERERHVAEDHATPAWTPPPPGSTREQLPDVVLAAIRPGPYLSTACHAAFLCETSEPTEELAGWPQRLHARCRINNKFTGKTCVCGCHNTEEPTP